MVRGHGDLREILSKVFERQLIEMVSYEDGRLRRILY